ncbi:hypothetical protein FNU76_04180 [Chitinimonas arctica]|uniref:DUF1311 domain-containing protein n=1 Tax=Chitinimonas arctica TaxID=2594795 RepID=A0A516SBU0_9NEIS|nr:hypothetical protein [Chitinimonas arctica]QDQ25614.1 hypothetical protein FNU76_04180 [Chitinimonas arctica]
MKLSSSALIAGILLCYTLPASAQDIDRYAAAANMHIWVYAAEGIATRCAKAYPGIAKQIANDIAKWKRADKAAIDRAAILWRQMEAASPRPASEVQEDEMQLDRLWSQLSEQGPQDPPNVGKLRCSAYFADRAGGALRAHRPEVYSALGTK